MVYWSPAEELLLQHRPSPSPPPAPPALIISNNSEMKDFFSGLELKFLSLISDSDYKSLINTSSAAAGNGASGGDDSRCQIEICRVCCHHKPNAMLNIFSAAYPGEPDGMTFATKIRVCVDVVIDEQDTLPKSICRDCAQNLNVCYEFQRLCRDSDYDLRRDKTLRDMIMEQVLDKTMGIGNTSSPGDSWSGSNSSQSGDLLRAFEFDSADDKGPGQEPRLHGSGSEHPVNTPRSGQSIDGSPLITEDRSAGSAVSGGQLVPQSSLSPLPSSPASCDIRKFQCDLCGARFFDIYNFKTHCRIHKIVKKYACGEPGCGKKFRTNVMLKIHSR